MNPLDLFDLPPEVVTAVIVAEYVVKILAVGMVPENRNPASSQAWLLAILFIPVIGVPAFLLLGNPYLTGKRHLIQAEANLLYSEELEDWPTVPAGVEVDPGLRTILEMNRTLTAMPCMTGEYVDLHHDYAESIAAMTAAVRTARHHVHVEFYAASWDDETEEFFAVLIEAAERGVVVRVLVDHLGSLRYRGFGRLRRRLRRSPVEFHLMLPVNPFSGRFRRPDLRNHRKLLVVDGAVGFTGSQNLISRHYGSRRNARLGREWIDVMVEVRGEIVDALDAMFAVDWYTESGEVVDTLDALVEYDEVPVECPVTAFQLVPSGPGYLTEPNLRMFTALVSHARRRLRIVSPYFVPDQALLGAITSASYRGVEVELLVPERADQFLVHHAQRSYYRALLEAGVRVRRYRSPAVLHSKLVLIDDHIGVVGSSNMDMRSFSLNFEVSLVVLGGAAVADMNSVVDRYVAECTTLDLRSWLRRPWPGRYVDNVARLTSALQ
ncbi:MAG TPA: cardiolipin synthase [Actinomycetales bacterium]|nr:cardiolipin synthase [Actinomycetales bacterium]